MLVFVMKILLVLLLASYYSYLRLVDYYTIDLQILSSHNYTISNVLPRDIIEL